MNNINFFIVIRNQLVTFDGKYITYFYKKKQESNHVALLLIDLYLLIT